MSDSLHATAPHHLPSFVTGPGETDVLMVVVAVILALSVLGFGILFLRIHTLPERIAHKGHKLQFEIVAVLGLISLFTHMHIFWIIGLLLALVDLPDFGTPLNRIAGSAEKIAGIKPNEGMSEMPSEIVAASSTTDSRIAAPLQSEMGKRGDGIATSQARHDVARPSRYELPYA